MLSSLRNQAGSLWAKLLLAFLVMTFAVWGIEDMLRTGGRNAAVAHVGGEEVTQQQLLRAVERESEAMRQLLGKNYSPEMARNLGIHAQALNKIINGRLLSLEARRIGLKPSDDDVAAAIRTNPSFQGENGKFSKEQFLSLLRSARINEVAYVEDVRRGLADDTLTRTLQNAAAPLVTQPALETLYTLRNETRNADLLLLPLSLVAELPAPDDKTLNEFYEATKRDYLAPETRTLSYVVLRADDLRGQAQVTDAAIEAAYKERMDEFKRPELRDIEQMLFTAEADAQKAQALLKEGKPFAESAKLAKAQNQSLSLGKVARESLPESARDSVFALKSGETGAPVQSPFGWHIFKVNGIEPAHSLTLAEARPQIAKDLQSGSAENALNDVAAKLEDALAGGATMEEAAQPFGLKVVKTGPLDASGKAPDGSKAAGLPAFENFLATAFRLEEKTDSSTTPASAGTFFIVRAESVQPEHVRPLAEVKSLVLTAWQKEARGKKLAALADDVSAKLKANKDPHGFGGSIVATGPLKRSATETENHTALPPALVDELFASAKGQPTSAYALSGDRYAIAILRDIAPAPKPDDAALSELRRSLENTTRSELLEQYIASLRVRYAVRVNDAVLAQIAGQDGQK